MDVGTDLDRRASTNVYPEAMYRSSIGRYYYSCYHEVKKTYVSSTDWGDKNKSNHKSVARTARKNNRFIASALDGLRELREHADYHVWRCKALSPDRRQKPRCECDWDPDCRKNCSKAFDIAKMIMDELSR